MKWLSIALLLAGLVSCKEDNQNTLPPHLFMDNGEMSVLLNGEDIPDHLSNRVAVVVGTSTSCYPDKLSFSSTYYIGDNIERMAFSIDNIPLAIGHYSISSFSLTEQDCSSDLITGIFITSIADGDVNGDIYLPIENKENFISIDNYNQATGEITGTLQMTVAIELEDHSSQKVSGLLDTLQLTNGIFEANLR